MDQKQQNPADAFSEKPQQVAQPTGPQQVSVSPQAYKVAVSLPTNQEQQNAQTNLNSPLDPPKEPEGANLSSQTSISSTTPSNIAEKSIETPAKVVDSTTSLDSEAPVKAKQILQPESKDLSNGALGTSRIQYNSGELESQQSQEEQESDVDPKTEFASWTASEFIAHEKPSYWHFAVIGVSILVAVVIFAFTREILSVLVVIVLGAVFAIYGSAKPKTVQYRLTGEGVYTDEKLHKYNDFKSFSMIETAGLPYIQLMSRKRFMVPLTLYTEPNSIDSITEIIGRHVPYDQKQQDPVDKLSAKLRF